MDINARHSKSFPFRFWSAERYEQRKRNLAQMRIRSCPAVAGGLILAAGMILMLMMSTWSAESLPSYIESQSSLSIVDPDAVDWFINKDAADSCHLDFECLSTPYEKISLQQIDQLRNQTTKIDYRAIRVQIDADHFSFLSGERVIDLTLPRFHFETARVLHQGRLINTYFKNEVLTVSLPNQFTDGRVGFIKLDLLFEILPDGRTMQSKRLYEGTLISSRTGTEKIERHSLAMTTGANGAFGAVAKIVLALFCILLFLIVDSSPEALALALFMSFEGLAMGVGQGWLPLSYLGLGHSVVWTNMFYQMGDILKIYFFLQLARLYQVKLWPWIVGGFLVSIPYGFFMEYAHANNFTWQYLIPRSRDTLAGSIGLGACLYSLWTLKGQRLWWRQSALLLGCVAAVVEVTKSWLSHSESHDIYAVFGLIYLGLEANLAYLYVLSTLLNISSLENRVRSLTREKADATEIERQMQLGRSLQQAFLALPKLPDEINLSCHHEAAVYVSGDTYFVHWDEVESTVTFLLNDVTGHGVQAALKAFASNVIAKTIWVDRPKDPRRVGERRQLPARMERYDKLMDSLLCHSNGETVDDFNALLGAEFYIDTGRLFLYRANYNSPYIFEPQFDWLSPNDPAKTEGADQEKSPSSYGWNLEKVCLGNRQITERFLTPGSFVVFVSDGYLQNSRDEKNFLRGLGSRLATIGKEAFHSQDEGRAQLSTELVKGHIVDWAKQNQKDLIHDDQTVMVFQYTPTTRPANANISMSSAMN